MVGVGAGLGEQGVVAGGGRDGCQRNKREKNGILFYGLTCFLVQVLVTSSSGILSATLVDSGWAKEGPDSGCPRGREGEEDLYLKIIFLTQTVENNKVTAINLDYILSICRL